MFFPCVLYKYSVCTFSRLLYPRNFAIPIRKILESHKSLMGTGLSKQEPNSIFSTRMFTPSLLRRSMRRSLAQRAPVCALKASLRPVGANFYSTSSSSSSSSTKGSTGSKDKEPKIPLGARLRSAFTFTAATGLVVGATGLAGLVVYLVVSEIFLPSGDTQVFNKAVSLIEKDTKAQQLLHLESGTRLKAYGESSDNKWTRNRPIASTRRVDKSGKEHLFMRFHVESKAKRGSVQLETVAADVLHPEYSYIYLDVPGERRHYIIAPPKPPSLLGSRDPNAGFLGVKWGKN